MRRCQCYDGSLLGGTDDATLTPCLAGYADCSAINGDRGHSDVRRSSEDRIMLLRGWNGPIQIGSHNQAAHRSRNWGNRHVRERVLVGSTPVTDRFEALGRSRSKYFKAHPTPIGSGVASGVFFGTPPPAPSARSFSPVAPCPRSRYNTTGITTKEIWTNITPFVIIRLAKRKHGTARSCKSRLNGAVPGSKIRARLFFCSCCSEYDQLAGKKEVIRRFRRCRRFLEFKSAKSA